MQAIKNLYQIKGRADLATTTDSQDVQAEIIRLFEEDKATFLLLYGDNNQLQSNDTTCEDVIYV